MMRRRMKYHPSVEAGRKRKGRGGGEDKIVSSFWRRKEEGEMEPLCEWKEYLLSLTLVMGRDNTEKSSSSSSFSLSSCSYYVLPTVQLFQFVTLSFIFHSLFFPFSRQVNSVKV